MQFQEYARKVRKSEAERVLYFVEIQEEGRWVMLPEGHHKRSLARSVCVKEAASRQCKAKVCYRWQHRGRQATTTQAESR